MQAAEATASSSRRRVRLFVAAVLIAELLIPLRYYLGSDRYDERFAWRMFSVVRVQECDVRAIERVNVGGDAETRTIDLPRAIHFAWISTLERNRADVIRAFLERRCTEPDRVSVEIINECVSPAGERLAAKRWPMQCDRDHGT